jgi:cardiolipin synthase
MLPAIAKEKMIVQHCYPSDTELLQCWGQEAKRLNSFQIIVPQHYDVVFLGKECDSNFPSLISYGVQLFGYRRAILHSKFALIDDFYAAVGSYNINVRSSRADMECTFFIQCAEFGRLMQEKFEEDLQQCEKRVPSKLAKFRSRFSIPVIDAILRYLFF